MSCDLHHLSSQISPSTKSFPPFLPTASALHQNSSQVPFIILACGSVTNTRPYSWLPFFEGGAISWSHSCNTHLSAHLPDDMRHSSVQRLESPNTTKTEALKAYYIVWSKVYPIKKPELWCTGIRSSHLQLRRWACDQRAERPLASEPVDGSSVSVIQLLL